MFKKLLPREDRFFDLFDKLVVIIQEALDLFGEMLRDYDRREEIVYKIKELESDADRRVHEVISLLNNTFVTPFDREDIQKLVYSLDDVIDLTEATSARMEIYDLPEPTDEVRELSRILRHAFKMVSYAITKLRDTKNHEDVLSLCVEVNSLENEGDSVLRLALRHLFKEAKDALYVIKIKEIYENLEEAIDRCEDLANVLETIVLKYS